MNSDAIVRLLTEHWLMAITCRHNEKTDEALCYCGWRGPECANVGDAVKSWAEHVTEPLRSVERCKTFVYVVTAGQYSDYGIRAILSTRDLAGKYIQSHTEGCYDIEEWELDAD